MAKRREYQSKSSSYGTFSGQQRRNSEQEGYKGKRVTKNYGRANSSKQNSMGKQNNFNKQNNSSRQSSFNKHGILNKQNNISKFGTNRYNKRIKAEETVDDIKIDINRIEKEIELELKEIRSIKL